MIVLNHFDHGRCLDHLARNEDGSLLLTMKNDSEFTIIHLNAARPGTDFATGTRFPDHPIRFKSSDVAWTMLLPRDARLQDGDPAERVVSTRQRRKLKPRGAENAHDLAAA